MGLSMQPWHGYEAFGALCTHLGANVTEEQWARWAGKLVNERPWATEPLSWTPEQNAAFQEQAGAMQAHFGYEGVN